MPWNSGVYTRGYASWSNDANNNLPISSTKFDLEDNDFAAGLNNCVTIDGLNQPNATISPKIDATYNLGTGALRWNTVNSVYGLFNETAALAVANEVATLHVSRATSYTGGTVGFVSAGLRADVTVGANDANFEWAVVGVMNNSATGGQNVGVYGQGNRQTNTTGPTWGSVAEVIDNSAQANPTTGLVGLEVDNRSNGGDSHFQRIGVHIVASRPVGGGAATTCGLGLVIDNNADGANTSYGSGIFLGNAGGSLCTFATGINLLNGTYSSAAIWLPSAAAIVLDTPGNNQLLYDGTGILMKSSGSSASRLNSDGSIALGGSTLPIKISGTTSASGTAGATQAVPATVLGYLVAVINGTTVKIPYFSN